MCCKTCHPDSVADCQKCSALGKQGSGGHVAVPVGSGARAFGMTGSLVARGATSIMVLWIQNVNNTFALQNASLPISERPRLNTIEGVKLDLGTIVGHTLTGKASATFVDTSSGEAHSAAVLHCPDDCKLEVPKFKTDIAVRVEVK